PMAWLENLSGIQKLEKISTEELLEEIILMGLRLREGIRNNIFQTHFQKNLDEILDIKKLQMLADQGIIDFSENHIRVTDSARILTNSVIEKVLSARYQRNELMA
ncbi:MAG: hypothetical protein FJX34_06150, partial [Alphaproteobacteria bacterium]|nr:hypothetical protein [Alphaproteobacteria bacterium]